MNQLRTRETVHVENNVRLVVRERGKLVRRLCREGHNVVVNKGRNWLRDRLFATSFYPPLAPGFPAGGTAPGVTAGWPIDDAGSNYVMRFVALGTGGVLATPVPGAFYENNHVEALESPVQVTVGPGERWMLQFLPQDPNSLLSFPTPYEACLRFIIGTSDITYSQGVPVINLSEIAAFTSAANPYAKPEMVQGIGPVGISMYNIFEPLPKTLDMVVEGFWYMRY